VREMGRVQRSHGVQNITHGCYMVVMSQLLGASVSAMRGTWRLWLGIAAVVLLGVPIMQVLSWMVGGIWGFLGLVILGTGAALILWSSADPRR